MTLEQALQLRAIIEKAVQFLEAKDALAAPTLFPEWEIGAEYPEGIKLRYNDILYQVLQTHTSQETWTPDDSPSLFTKVLISETGEILDWEQPSSTNAYQKNDKVKHNNKIWISTVDNNVWEPGVYGWNEI